MSQGPIGPARTGRPPYDGCVWILAAIVVVAVVLMVLASRNRSTGEPMVAVVAISPDGLRTGEEPERLVSWDDVFEITVVTRRELHRTWFGFELRAEGHGLLAIDGSDGPGEAFLAESHRFAGFDHAGLGEALETRGARVVCFSR